MLAMVTSANLPIQMNPNQTKLTPATHGVRVHDNAMGRVAGKVSTNRTTVASGW